MRWTIVDPEDPRWARAHEVCFPGVAPPPARDARWLASRGGEVYAFASAVMSQRPARHGLGGPVCYLSRAGVLPDRRGLGLQAEALRVRERWARSRGAVAMITDTAPWNSHSERNLARSGFELWTPPDPWSGRDWHYWKKSLRRP